MKSNTFQNNLQHQFLHKTFQGSKVSSGYQLCENRALCPNILETVYLHYQPLKTHTETAYKMTETTVILTYCIAFSHHKNFKLHNN